MVNSKSVFVKSIKILLFAVIILLFNTCNTYIVKSEENYGKNIILLMDKSSSMQKNDPDKLSVVAGQILLDCINDENVKFNIISFGDTKGVDYFKKISEEPSREDLKDFLSKIKFEDNYTDLKEGLKEAIKQLGEVQGNKQIIILTDGKETTGDGIKGKYKEEMDTVVDEATKEKIKISTIGLSDEVDRKRLNYIADKTKGESHYIKSPADLFHIFSNITGDSSELFTLTNYTTDTKKEEIINLSNTLEEVILNIASLDNKSPVVKVLLNGKKIEPEKYEKGYEIYRLKNGNMGRLEIISEENSNNNITVQVKSKNKLIIEEEKNNLAIPKKVPIEFCIDIENKDEEIPGLYVEKYLNNNLEKNINKNNKEFKDNFTINEPGKYIIKYVARDKDGGVVAVNETLITVEDGPPFFYEEPIDKLILGDTLNIKIVNIDDSKVESLGGELDIEYQNGEIDKITLQENNGDLIGVLEVKHTGGAKYRANINGRGFGYSLPYRELKIIDKPTIDIEATPLNGKVIKLGNKIDIELIIKECVLYNDEIVEILDCDDNKIGEFTLEPNSKDIINLSLIPKVQTNSMKLHFKTKDNIKITEELYLNLGVLTLEKYILKIIRVPLIIIIFLTFITILVCYIGIINFRKLKDFSISKVLRYKDEELINTKNIRLNLNLENKVIYLNYYEDKTEFLKCSKKRDKSVIGYFSLTTLTGLELNENLSFFKKIKEGLIYKLKGEKNYFKVIYTAELRGQVNEKNKPIIGEEDYESIKKIVVNKNENIIKIEFKS